MTNIRKFIYIADDGLQTLSHNGDISNIGGTSHHTFTVDGKGLLFDDGSSTNGGPGGVIASNLQQAYNNSTDGIGNATIHLQTGKDLVIYDDTDTGVFFKIDAETGKITITGDLQVNGTTTIMESINQIVDHWNISPNTPNTVALYIEPDVGVTPVSDLITVKNTNGSAPVFRVDATGKAILKQVQVNGNMTIVGTINGVDVVNLQNEVYDHLTSPSFPKHTASQISVTQLIGLPPVTNVQQALDALANHINDITSASVIGVEFIQTTSESIWTIPHSKNTKRIQFSVYDENDEWILPDKFKFIDMNTVEISFGRAMTGRAVLMMF
jgi:hypothetical protein